MEKIKIRSNLKRPLMFRIPGETIRLAPGESTEIPEHCLETQELKKLCLQNSLSVLREEKKEARKIDKAEEGKKTKKGSVKAEKK